jgi:hypothetical protein
MHHRGHTREEPVVRGLVQRIDSVENSACGKAAPSPCEHAALPGLRQGIEYDAGTLLSATAARAAEADVDRRRAGLYSKVQLDCAPMGRAARIRLRC